MKKILLMGIFVCSNSFAMISDETEKLYKLCQNWFQDSDLRTIASHIVSLNQRKGSYVGNPNSVQVRSSTAQAQFNVLEQLVTVHNLEFPGVPTADPVATIKFDEMLKIKGLIESKNKK